MTTATQSTQRGALQDSRPACLRFDPEMWFPVSYHNADGKVQTAIAAAICAECPVRRACLEEALDREGGIQADSRHGIYGGYTPKERFGIHRARVRRAAREAA